MVNKRPRFLPKYVSAFADRHGKKRYRYRRAGYASGYFKSELGTEEFRQEYAAFEAGEVADGPIQREHPVNSVADLVSRYTALATRLGPTQVTQTKVRAILGRFLQRYGVGEKGPRYIPDFTFEHIDAILDKERVKRPEGKRMIGGIEAARKMRKELMRLFDFADKVGMIAKGANPVRLSQDIRVGAGEKSKGHITWSEADITAYRKVHALGTSARLALELLLWTGQRRGDGWRFSPEFITDGYFDFEQDKGGKTMKLLVAPQLLAAIVAMPVMPARKKAFLLTSFGKPYSYAGFGNAFRAWCDEAGLFKLSAHGLRKANARRMAELGMANQTLKAVGGWTNDREVALYTAGADQARLSSLAITALSDWEAGRVANLGCLTDPKLLEEPQES